MVAELTHARLHPSHCMAPGLFKSLSKGTRKARLFVSYPWGGNEIRFVGSEQLGADDMRFLQVIVALANFIGVRLGPEPAEEVQKQVRLGLAIDSNKILDARMFSCRAGKLLGEAGMTDGGGNTNILKSSLKRMSSVSVAVRRKEAITSYQMLSFIEGGAKQLHIAVNPLLASAFENRASHTRIDLNEVRNLKSDAACLLHLRLCGFVDQRQPKRIGVDRLCSYAWGDGRAKPEVERKRRERIRNAVRSLSDCGWVVSDDGPNQFQISRPAGKRPVTAVGRKW